MDDSDEFIITAEFIKNSSKNFRNEPAYETYIKPLIRALGKDD